MTGYPKETCNVTVKTVPRHAVAEHAALAARSAEN